MTPKPEQSREKGVIRELAFPVLAIAGLLLAVRYRQLLLSVAAVAFVVVFFAIYWLADAYELWSIFHRDESAQKDRSSHMGNHVS